MGYLTLVTPGQKLSLVENSEILIFDISSVLEGKKMSTKKGMRWLGHGFKFGLNKNGSKLKKTKEFIF